MPKRGDTVYIPFNKKDVKEDEAFLTSIKAFKSQGIKCIYKDTKAKKLYEIEKLYIIGHCNESLTSLFCEIEPKKYIEAKAEHIAKTLIPSGVTVKTTQIKAIACYGAAHGTEGQRFITELKNQIIKRVKDKGVETINNKITVYGCKRSMIINNKGKSKEESDNEESNDEKDKWVEPKYHGTDGSYKPEPSFSMNHNNEEVKFLGDTQSYNTSNENEWWCVII